MTKYLGRVETTELPKKEDEVTCDVVPEPLPDNCMELSDTDACLRTRRPEVAGSEWSKDVIHVNRVEPARAAPADGETVYH